MRTTKESIVFVCDQLADIPDITYQKMFGEYMVYVQGKLILLVCDNCVMVNRLPQLSALLAGTAEAYPCKGAKLHYILDMENHDLVRPVIDVLVQLTSLPQKRKHPAQGNK